MDARWTGFQDGGSGESAAARRGLAVNLSMRTLMRALRLRLSRIGGIIMFHEVHQSTDAELRTGCSPIFLESLVRTIQRSGIEIVTMDEALRRMREEQTRPFVAVTFDDGYRDTFVVALPILERLGVPFTVYVPTQAVTRELYAWWLGLRLLFQQNDVVVIEPMDRRFVCPGLQSKVAGLRSATNWIATDFRREHALEQVFVSYGIRLEGLVDRYFINAAELQALGRRRLVSIGGHSTSHAALSTLPDEQMQLELTENRAFLEGLIDRPVTHLAYPYGSPTACGRREFAAAERLGFVSAVTSRRAPIHLGTKVHALPRLDLNRKLWRAALRLTSLGRREATRSDQTVSVSDQ